MKNIHTSLLLASISSSCGTDQSGQSAVCFSIRYPFEKCDAISKDEKDSDTNESDFDVATPVQMDNRSAYEGESEWEIAQPVPMHLERLDEFQASAKIYARKTGDSLIERSFRLDNLGVLSNSYFQTPAIESRATSPSNAFDFDPESPAFRETSLFVNAASMRRWLIDLGQTVLPYFKVEISEDSTLFPDGNNAIYIPSYNGLAAHQIIVGKGDGDILQNLTTDADIVAHQYAVAVIYNSIDSKQMSLRKSLLISGLADALVALRNDDPCLGPSVCPADSTACVEANQCLRSAENNISLVTPMRSGQNSSIAGAIWDLRQQSELSTTVLARLIMTSLKYLNADQPDTGAALASALLRADWELHRSANAQLIASALASRGAMVPLD
jgi:hypothetical protein